jgi:hypothetical protein
MEKLIAKAEGVLASVVLDKADRLITEIVKEKLQQQETTKIQTLILSKEKFKTLDAAKAWVKENKFKLDHEGKGPDETETSWRFRQMSPGDFQENSFRTIAITDGVKAVIGRPKEKAEKVDESEELYEVALLPILKADEDQRIAFGVVLEPKEVDAQGDTIKKLKEISDAAHNWLGKYQDRGLMHTKIVNSKIEIWESYIAPVNLTFGDEKVKKGSWLLMYHILDDGMWQQIKEGKLTGFSIGGFARRTKV